MSALLENNLTDNNEDDLDPVDYSFFDDDFNDEECISEVDPILSLKKDSECNYNANARDVIKDNQSIIKDENYKKISIPCPHPLESSNQIYSTPLPTGNINDVSDNKFKLERTDSRLMSSPCGDILTYNQDQLERLESATADHFCDSLPKLNDKLNSINLNDELLSITPEVNVLNDNIVQDYKDWKFSEQENVENLENFNDFAKEHNEEQCEESLESEPMNVRKIATIIKELSRNSNFRSVRPPWRDPNSKPLPSDDAAILEDMLKECNEIMMNVKKNDGPKAFIAVRRPYHTTLNRWRQQERIQFENFMLAHRLKNVKPSATISRNEQLRHYKQYFVTPATVQLVPELDLDSSYQYPLQPVSSTFQSKSTNHSRSPSLVDDKRPKTAKTPINNRDSTTKGYSSYREINCSHSTKTRAKSTGGKCNNQNSKFGHPYKPDSTPKDWSMKQKSKYGCSVLKHPHASPSHMSMEDLNLVCKTRSMHKEHEQSAQTSFRKINLANYKLSANKTQ